MHWSSQILSFNNTRNDSIHGHHQRVNTKIRLIIFFAAKYGETLYCQWKTRPGTDCGSDHEPLIAKFRLISKKVEKTTRPFRYDLNQTSYNYTVKVTNRFKGLDLIDSAWRTTDGGSWHCIGGGDQEHPQEKEMQKDKMVVWGGFKNSWEKNRNERQRRKGKIYPFECRVPNSKER